MQKTQNAFLLLRQLADDHRRETVDVLALCLGVAFSFEKPSFTAECLKHWNGWAQPSSRLRSCVSLMKPCDV